MKLALVVIAAAVFAPGLAAAQVDCNSLPNPIYLLTGDTQEPHIKTIGRALRDSATHPMTLIYLTSGSCTNIDAIYNNTPLTMNPKYVPSTLEDPAWTAAQPPLSCTI